jgi:hypothetical protein
MSMHKTISFVKSTIRLIGCVFGMVYFRHTWLPLHAFAFLFLAEILGVIEEFYELPVGESYKAFSTKPMGGPWQTGRYIK